MKRLLVSILAIVMLVAISTPAFANYSHSQITQMSYTAKKSFFGDYLHRSGESCYRVTKIFFQGFDKEKSAYWNVKCKNGRAYCIQIKNNTSGSTRIMDCELCRMIGVECFKKFSDQ